MELKTNDVISIVSKNYERYKEQQQKEQQQKLIKKNQTRQKIAKSAALVGIGLVLGAAPAAHAMVDGHNEIVSQFDDATTEYGVRSYSNGYFINRGGDYVSLEEGISGMIDNAREVGMNDVEIAIGLNSIFPSYLTDKYIDTSLEQRCHQCIGKHAEKEISEGYSNGK